MSEAFSRGGQQLTEVEKSEFRALNPRLSDTFEQAMIKAQMSRKYLSDRYDLRLKMMGPRQRPQVPSVPPQPSSLKAPARPPSGLTPKRPAGVPANATWDGTHWIEP